MTAAGASRDGAGRCPPPAPRPPAAERPAAAGRPAGAGAGLLAPCSARSPGSRAVPRRATAMGRGAAPLRRLLLSLLLLPAPGPAGRGAALSARQLEPPQEEPAEYRDPCKAGRRARTGRGGTGLFRQVAPPPGSARRDSLLVPPQLPSPLAAFPDGVTRVVFPSVPRCFPAGKLGTGPAPLTLCSQRTWCTAPCPCPGKEFLCVPCSRSLCRVGTWPPDAPPAFP